MSTIREISDNLQNGRAKNVKSLVRRALEEGVEAKAILEDGLLDGMMKIGEKFKLNEVFVPEVLVAARAMNAGLTLLEPKLIEKGIPKNGKVVIGTVKGDWHDIGKNIVAMMLKGAGMEVVDVGIDVEPSVFIDKAEEIGADIIGISALLTTTMQNMKGVLDLLQERGLRDNYIVMVGGAPINQTFAEEIGADYYTSDAVSAAKTAQQVIEEKYGK